MVGTLGPLGGGVVNCSYASRIRLCMAILWQYIGAFLNPASIYELEIEWIHNPRYAQLTEMFEPILT